MRIWAGMTIGVILARRLCVHVMMIDASPNMRTDAAVQDLQSEI